MKAKTTQFVDTYNLPYLFILYFKHIICEALNNHVCNNQWGRANFYMYMNEYHHQTISDRQLTNINSSCKHKYTLVHCLHTRLHTIFTWLLLAYYLVDSEESGPLSMAYWFLAMQKLCNKTKRHQYLIQWNNIQLLTVVLVNIMIYSLTKSAG